MCATTYLKYMRAESSRAESGRAESGRAESGQAAERAQSCRAAARAPVPLRVSDSKEYREHQIQFRKMHACEMRQRSKLAVENTYYSVSETWMRDTSKTKACIELAYILCTPLFLSLFLSMGDKYEDVKINHRCKCLTMYLWYLKSNLKKRVCERGLRERISSCWFTILYNSLIIFVSEKNTEQWRNGLKGKA